MRMYILIKARLASKLELETVYTLDEALKLYALYCMDMDIERGHAGGAEAAVSAEISEREVMAVDDLRIYQQGRLQGKRAGYR